MHQTSPLSSLNSVELQKSSVVVLDVDMVRDQNSVLVSLVVSYSFGAFVSGVGLVREGQCPVTVIISVLTV